MEHATVAKTGSLLQSGLTSLYNDAVDGSGKMISLSQVRTLEKKLAKRLGEGVERLGVMNWTVVAHPCNQQGEAELDRSTQPW